MLCVSALESNPPIEKSNEINKLQKSLAKGKFVVDEPEIDSLSKEPILKNLSLAFSTDENENGNILIKEDILPHEVNDKKTKQNIVRSNSKGSNTASSVVDLPLANGSNSSLNSHDISRKSYEEVPYHSKLNLSCSSIRPGDNNSRGSLDKSIHYSFSEDESFDYNSHLSEIDRNEDIKDLRVKLKKAIKSLDKKKKDLTLAAVIGQCLLEANTNLKTLNYKLMNKRDIDGSSISSSYLFNSEIDSPSAIHYIKKSNNNNTRVYTGVGRQEKNHLNLFPDNGSLDENTYNSVVEYHEENYNRVIKQLTDINNQLENHNLDLKRQVNDLEGVVKDTKNKYNRGLVESEKKLNEMEDKLNTMTELNNKLLKDNQDLIKEFNSKNNTNKNEIKQEQKLIDSLYNELYDMQHKIEEVNNSKEKCEKKYEKLNMEYIKSKDEIGELKKLQEQNKIIEQVNNEQENRIRELNDYMEYQRDYISKLENQLLFCTFNPVQNNKMSTELLKKIEEDDMEGRIVELTNEEENSKTNDDDSGSNDRESHTDDDGQNNDSFLNSSNDLSEEDNYKEEDDRHEEQIFKKNLNKRRIRANENDDSNNRYQNSQLVLYSPNIFHQRCLHWQMD